MKDLFLQVVDNWLGTYVCRLSRGWFWAGRVTRWQLGEEEALRVLGCVPTEPGRADFTHFTVFPGLVVNSRRMTKYYSDI